MYSKTVHNLECGFDAFVCGSFHKGLGMLFTSAVKINFGHRCPNNWIWFLYHETTKSFNTPFWTERKSVLGLPAEFCLWPKS